MEIKIIKESENNIEMNLITTDTEQEILNKICLDNSISIKDLIILCLNNCISDAESLFNFIRQNRPGKCNTGIIGHPIFKYKDKVGFYIKPYGSDKEIFCIGEVYIIDSFGTFGQKSEPSYDIMVENYNNTNSPCLVKHIRESELYKI